MKRIGIIGLSILCTITLAACEQSASTSSHSESHVSKSVTKKSSSKLSSSSSSVVSSSSASSSSTIDPAKSKAELKAVVTSEMPMDQWQTLQSDLLSAAQVDDIAHPEQQGSIEKFNTRLQNISKLEAEAKSDKREQKFMTTDDYAKYKDYETKLAAYLSALHDYASTYQSDMPSLNDSNTDADTASDLKSEINEAKQSFDTANAAWVAAYNAIANI